MRSLRALSLAFVSASAVYASAIDVNINGHPVQFTDAEPRMIGGRVMVPLRPVLEAMQIHVEYDAVKREVVATEADKTVTVTLGSREANANGRLMWMDVPAQELGGRTYIPLRFFGEALGAMIDWDAQRQVVEITGRFGVDKGAPPDPISGVVPALSLDSDQKPWFVGGETVRFSMQANPNLSPILYVNGGKTALPMREVSPGKYQANYVIPGSGSSRVAFLDDTPFSIVTIGGKQTVVPLKQQIAVDNTPPQILNPEPANSTQTMIGRPVIGAALSDSGGSGLDLTSITIWVDGVDVTTNASVTRQFVSYRPESNLTPGKHTFRISARDMAGNEAQENGSFTVGSASSLVTSAQLAENRIFSPGDEIRLSGQVTSDVTAIEVRLGNRKRTSPATIGANGNFSYSHTVSRNDSFEGATVSLLLTTRTGVKTEYLLNQTISTVQAEMTAPTLNDRFTFNQSTGKLTLSGTAKQAKTVRISVQPVSTVLGVFKSTGSAVTSEVAVNADGSFTFNDLTIGKVLGKTPEQFVVKLKSVTEKGRESEEVSITLENR